MFRNFTGFLDSWSSFRLPFWTTETSVGRETQCFIWPGRLEDKILYKILIFFRIYFDKNYDFSEFPCSPVAFKLFLKGVGDEREKEVYTFNEKLSSFSHTIPDNFLFFFFSSNHKFSLSIDFFQLYYAIHEYVNFTI